MGLRRHHSGVPLYQREESVAQDNESFAITGKKMAIDYQINRPVSADQFIDLLRDSTLGHRRPIDDRECMEGMIKNSNLIITAWDNENLVGIARSMTDFHYACYLSDLAVARHHQGCGIGKRLQVITQEQLGPKCKLILVAAPAANTYYEHLGFQNNPRCWVLEREHLIDSKLPRAPQPRCSSGH